jgi:hypothetical protein
VKLNNAAETNIFPLHLEPRSLIGVESKNALGALLSFTGVLFTSLLCRPSNYIVIQYEIKFSEIC